MASSSILLSGWEQTMRGNGAKTGMEKVKPMSEQVRLVMAKRIALALISTILIPVIGYLVVNWMLSDIGTTPGGKIVIY